MLLEKDAISDFLEICTMSTCEVHVLQPVVLHLFPGSISIRKGLNQSQMVMTKRTKSFPTGRLGVGWGTRLANCFWPRFTFTYLCWGPGTRADVLEWERSCSSEECLHFICCQTLTRWRRTQLRGTQIVHTKCSVGFYSDGVASYRYCLDSALRLAWNPLHSANKARSTDV